MSAPLPSGPDRLTRAELDDFLQAFSHEIRNRLNGISLEASDLAEQVGAGADPTRLQAAVRECGAFLKAVRELVTPEDPGAPKLPIPEATGRLRARKL